MSAALTMSATLTVGVNTKRVHVCHSICFCGATHGNFAPSEQGSGFVLNFGASCPFSSGESLKNGAVTENVTVNLNLKCSQIDVQPQAAAIASFKFKNVIPDKMSLAIAF